MYIFSDIVIVSSEFSDVKLKEIFCNNHLYWRTKLYVITYK
jgi:hypothetical protein